MVSTTYVTPQWTVFESFDYASHGWRSANTARLQSECFLECMHVGCRCRGNCAFCLSCWRAVSQLAMHAPALRFQSATANHGTNSALDKLVAVIQALASMCAFHYLKAHKLYILTKWARHAHLPSLADFNHLFMTSLFTQYPLSLVYWPLRCLVRKSVTFTMQKVRGPSGGGGDTFLHQSVWHTSVQNRKSQQEGYRLKSAWSYASSEKNKIK